MERFASSCGVYTEFTLFTTDSAEVKRSWRSTCAILWNSIYMKGEHENIFTVTWTE